LTLGKFPLHAAQQQANPPALRAHGWRDFRDRFARPELGKKRFIACTFFGKSFSRPSRAPRPAPDF